MSAYRGGNAAAFPEIARPTREHPHTRDRGAPTNRFFRPMAKWVAFFADRKLKKVAIAGGAPIVICDAPNPRGEAWGVDNEHPVLPPPAMWASRASARRHVRTSFRPRQGRARATAGRKCGPVAKRCCTRFGTIPASTMPASRFKHWDSDKHSIVLHGGGYDDMSRYRTGGGTWFTPAPTGVRPAVPFPLAAGEW